MAENLRKLSEQPKSTVDKELRLRSLKDRQNEERQRKLEEIKAQALAAQVFKEQKEQERRKRLDDLRCRDDERRQQVEERKKQIQDAERDRLEFILRRNQEREQRFESRRRNERSNAVFAFGSSTPRMLDPNDVTASYWNTRRATSIQNIVTSTNPSMLTRRQSERELDAGTKKRATSATGLERTGESNAPVIPAGCVSGYTGRRRTDLVPTIPAKDLISSSRKSLNQSPASSRPSSSLSQQSTTSLASSASVRHRLTTAPRKPRPVSIAGTGISTDAKGDHKPPLPKAKKPIAKATTSDNVVLKSKTKTRVDSTSNNTNKISKSEKSQIAVTSQKSETTVIPEPKLVTGDIESNVHVPQTTKSDLEVPEVIIETDNDKKEPILVDIEEKKDVIETVKVNDPEPSDTIITEIQKSDHVQLSINEESHALPEIKETEIKLIEEQTEPVVVVPEIPVEPEKPQPTSDSQIFLDSNTVDNIENEMTTSMTKTRINTEEEAKAALAERRRLIREEAERQAELERLRIEAEAKAELERQQREEEQIRELIELQRQTEQERLQEAIKETQKREEEERLKKEEEQRLKLLKEEAEKKAKEDAERQKAELKERLKNEEKEREARRKRVEAIMSRTRGRNATAQSVDENKSDDIKSEVEGQINGTKIEEQENGTTKLSKDVVNNVIPSDLIKNAITIESMDSNDSLNSNNTWRDNQQYGNFVCNNNS